MITDCKFVQHIHVSCYITIEISSKTNQRQRFFSIEYRQYMHTRPYASTEHEVINFVISSLRILKTDTYVIVIEQKLQFDIPEMEVNSNQEFTGNLLIVFPAIEKDFILELTYKIN